MRLDQLKFFVAAVERGSISEAARRVHLAQPAFSAHIKALENELGVRLFERSTRGVQTTEAGQRLYDGALALLRHADQIRENAISTTETLSGEVRIVLASSTAPLLAGQVFVETQRLYPHIRLSILDLLRVASENLVTSRLVDFGLLPNVASLDGALSQPLLAQDLYLVGKAFPEAVKGTVAFKDLHHFPLVMGGRRNQMRIDLENTAARRSQRINVVSEQDSLSVYRSIVLAGHYFTVVPYSAFAIEIEGGSLRAAKIVRPSIERTVSLVWHKYSEMSGPAKGVMEVVRQTTAAMISAGTFRGRSLL